MYGWIWRHLPGPVVVKALLATVLFAGVVALLWLVVFPAIEGKLPFNEVTVSPDAAGTPAP